MKILVLGIGNILFGDEGVGVHLAHLFAKNYCFEGKHQVDIVDGGTLAQFLIPTITSYERVLIFDCVNVGNESRIGDVYAFDFNDIPLAITWQGSAHEVEMLQTLKMTEINGDLPPVKIIGVIPEVIGSETSFELSDAVCHGAEMMEDLAVKVLEEWGVQVKKIACYPLRELAQTTFRGF
ncbi:hydrogenase expression/formation protein [Helicobacter monodelphidis]|uniref:HyaD/HybD family hydrogenase maturation endopeptidase n=1 Tax=Helicobacter sp. 15-1451 TaxID=2004995 RepID=UPI000DCDE1FC|nr:HyaD/HybD family hydrogenase maturation endopeptidase [Helicobacter sp. 15-1451]RAX59229.1 hydrogenase expression/formation protein [Helicobacter sp. 15-1451]